MTRATPIPDTVTIHVPFHIAKRGGRKEMVLPEGAAQARKPDNTLVKALARAFRWKRMLESGEFASISELAEKEGIAFTYMARLMRLSKVTWVWTTDFRIGHRPFSLPLGSSISAA